MPLKSITRFITLTSLFLVPFFPIIVANTYFFPFITGKAFFFRILVEIAFAGWVVLAFLDAKYRPKLNALTIGITIFTLITLVADLLGVNPIRSIMSNFERMEGWITIAHLWMFFMAITYTFGSGEQGRKLWFRWLNVSLAVAFYIACYGALQWAGKIAVSQGGNRSDATLGNPIYMAIYMLLHSGIAAYLFMTTQLARKYLIAAHHKTVYMVREWSYGIIAVFFGVMVFATATRGAILGYIGAIMLALVLYAIFARKEGEHDNSKHILSVNTWRMISGGIIIVIILLGVTIWINKDSSFVQNNNALKRMTSISTAQLKTEGRSFIWPMAVKGAMQRPVLGWGQENFNYIFNTNYNPSMWNQEQWFDRAHSVYIDWLVASGFLGLLAYLALYVLFVIVVWKSSLRVSQKSILTGILAGYAVHNIFVFDNLASYVFFIVLLGFAVSQKGDKEGNVSGKSIFGNVPASQDLAEYVVAPIMIVLLALGIYFLNYDTIKANTGLIIAMQSCQGGKPDMQTFKEVFARNSTTANQEAREQLISSCAPSVIGGQYPNQTKLEVFNLANEQLDKQIAETPKDARAYVLGGAFLVSSGQFDKAITMLEKALTLSPKKQSLIVELANAYVNAGKFDKAIEILKPTYEMTPENTQVKQAYAMAMVLNKQEAEARKMFDNDPAIFESDIMARVYMSLKQYDKSLDIYKKKLAADPTSAELMGQLAQAQYTAGRIEDAVKTLESIGEQYPEYADQIQATIKQLRAEATKK